MEHLTLWTEKYRPKTLSDIILPAESRLKLEECKRNKDIPNFLFHGPAGTGKTSLAKIIANDILECDYLYINASDENGIDTVRTKIVNFAQTMSFNGGIKVIILDEGDYLSDSAQAALRNTMEEYSSITRFIITANYKHKIISALQSRTQTINFNNVVVDVAKYCLNILKYESIEVASEQKPLLLELITSVYPDIRKIVNCLQQSCIDKKLQIYTLKTVDIFLNELFELLTSDIVKIREHIIQNDMQYHNDHHLLMRSFLNFLYAKALDSNKKREMIVTIAEHMYRHTFVVDPEINCFCCFINLQKIFNT